MYIIIWHVREIYYRCSLRLLHVLVVSIGSSSLLEPPLAYIQHRQGLLPHVMVLSVTLVTVCVLLLDTSEVRQCVVIHGNIDSG